MSDCLRDLVVALVDAAHIVRCQHQSVTFQSYVPLICSGFLVHLSEVLSSLRISLQSLSNAVTSPVRCDCSPAATHCPIIDPGL